MKWKSVMKTRMRKSWDLFLDNFFVIYKKLSVSEFLDEVKELMLFRFDYKKEFTKFILSFLQYFSMNFSKDFKKIHKFQNKYRTTVKLLQ